MLNKKDKIRAGCSVDAERRQLYTPRSCDKVYRRSFIYIFGLGAASAVILSACGSAMPVSSDSPSEEPRHIESFSPIENEITDAGGNGSATKADAPIPDADRDRISDGDDGCLDDTAVIIKTPGVVITPERPRFKHKSARINEAGKEILNLIANVMNDNPKVETVLIVGHAASNEGRPSARLALSKKRAKLVMDQLVKRGVDKGRLRMLGLSDACPASIGNTPEAVEKNRRVEFNVLDIVNSDSPIACKEAHRRKLVPDIIFKK